MAIDGEALTGGKRARVFSQKEQTRGLLRWRMGQFIIHILQPLTCTCYCTQYLAQTCQNCELGATQPIQFRFIRPPGHRSTVSFGLGIRAGEKLYRRE